MQDIPRPPRPRPVLVEAMEDVYKGPSFSVNHVARMPKLEDKDAEFMQELLHDPSSSQLLYSNQDQNRLSSGHLNDRGLRASSQRCRISVCPGRRVPIVRAGPYRINRLDVKGQGARP
jgi:hypothetical protein